jgi:hypothetical protein
MVFSIKDTKAGFSAIIDAYISAFPLGTSGLAICWAEA